MSLVTVGRDSPAPPSRLGWACAIGAFLGAGLIMLFMWWTSAVDWAVDIGGKSFSSIPAFVPVTFEVAVLFGALGTVAAFFVRSRLWPGKEARTPAGATDDTFGVVVRASEAGLRSRCGPKNRGSSRRRPCRPHLQSWRSRAGPSRLRHDRAAGLGHHVFRPAALSP